MILLILILLCGLAAEAGSMRRMDRVAMLGSAENAECCARGSKRLIGSVAFTRLKV